MATNSTFKIERFVDACSRRADMAGALAAAGHSDQPGLDIATEVMESMIRGNAMGERMNWKWNRFNVVPNPLGVLSAIGPYGTFITNAFQQDYAVPGCINVDWIEEAPYININQLQQPKQVLWADPKRNLSKEYLSVGCMPFKICFLPNYLLDFGIWGQTSQFQVDGMTNPGPNVPYIYPLGAGVAPNNPCTQIQDANGNFYALTTYGTCGSTIPTFPATPTYPTLQSPTTAASTVADGTCVWTALNPNGMGFRLHCPPAGNSVVWLFRVVAQMIPPVFTSLKSTLGQLPDNMVPYFRRGFEAKCCEHSPDPKVRAKATQPRTGMLDMWMADLQRAVKTATKEQEDQVLVPEGGFASGPSLPTAVYPFTGS